MLKFSKKILRNFFCEGKNAKHFSKILLNPRKRNISKLINYSTDMC